MEQHPIPGKNTGDTIDDDSGQPAAVDKPDSSYYYDDATGYEVYDPAAEDDDDDETETPDR